jgi:hypothetical protein
MKKIGNGPLDLNLKRVFYMINLKIKFMKESLSMINMKEMEHYILNIKIKYIIKEALRTENF